VEYLKKATLMAAIWTVAIVVAMVVALPFFDHSRSQHLEKVTLQLNWFPDGEHAYLYLAKKAIFPEHGFDVELLPGKGSELSAKLVAAGSVNFALTAPETALAVNEQGGKLVSVGIVYDKTPVVIYSKPDTKIYNLDDLCDKKLGTLFGSSTYLQYSGLVKLGLIDSQCIKEQRVDPRSGPDLLRAGSIEALMYFGHYVEVFKKKDSIDYNKIRFSQVLADRGMSLIGMVLVTNEATLKRLGEQKVQHFANSVKKAIIAAKNDPNDAILALVAANPSVNETLEQIKLESVLEMICGLGKNACQSALGQTTDIWKATAITARRMGLIRDESSWEKIVKAAFMNGLD